ncbi:hypothetical protein Pfo_001536 [Paulownia fortunei]|nr:hypothetical protein Pfo_001536 [Paulownia fortunei]
MVRLDSRAFSVFDFPLNSCLVIDLVIHLSDFSVEYLYFGAGPPDLIFGEFELGLSHQDLLIALLCCRLQESINIQIFVLDDLL